MSIRKMKIRLKNEIKLLFNNGNDNIHLLNHLFHGYKKFWKQPDSEHFRYQDQKQSQIINA